MIHFGPEDVDVILGGDVAPADGREMSHEGVGHGLRHESAKCLMEREALGLRRCHEFSSSIAVHALVCARDGCCGGKSLAAWAAS